MTKTFWLSFVNEGRFAGVAIVDVDDEDAAEAKAIIDEKFPRHAPGAEWIAAATRKAWEMAANPGAVELPPDLAATLPRNRLLQKPELEAMGLI